MFRRGFIGKDFFAFLLPLTFLWSWVACSLLCNEISERREKLATSITRQADDCLIALDLDSCPVTAGVALIGGRPTIVSPALVVQNIDSFQSPELQFFPVSIYPADLTQNSPPGFSSDPPLFLRHCAFRI